MKTTKLIELTNDKKRYKVLHDFNSILTLDNEKNVEEIIEHFVDTDRGSQIEAENTLSTSLFEEGMKAQENGDYEKAKEISNKLDKFYELVEYKKIINNQDIYCITFDEESLNEDFIDVLFAIEIWDNLDPELIEMYKEPFKTTKEFIEVFKDRIINGYFLDICEGGVAEGVIEHLLNE